MDCPSAGRRQPAAPQQRQGPSRAGAPRSRCHICISTLVLPVLCLVLFKGSSIPTIACSTLQVPLHHLCLTNTALLQPRPGVLPVARAAAAGQPGSLLAAPVLQALLRDIDPKVCPTSAPFGAPAYQEPVHAAAASMQTHGICTCNDAS